jgi:nucleoid-associated protein YejK
MQSAKATKSVIGAVVGFLTDVLHYNEAQIRIVMDSVVEYFEESPQEVNLQEIQNRAIPNPDHQAQFDEYTDEQEYELSANFKPNKNSYKSWKKFYYKSSGIIIDIDRQRVHDTLDYSNEGHYLIIKDRDGGLYAEYRKIITEDEVEE